MPVEDTVWVAEELAAVGLPAIRPALRPPIP